MNPNTFTDTRQNNLRFDANKIDEVTEHLNSLCSQNTGLGIHATSTEAGANISKPVKTLIKYFQSVYSIESLKEKKFNTNKDTNTDFVFVIDTRKQEPFDWKTTINSYQRIIHLSDLENGWDGYNAPSFSKEQIDLALVVYSQARSYSINRGLNFPKVEPFIAPCSDGSILFEWAGKRFPSRQLELYVPKEMKAEHLFEYLKTEKDSDEEGELGLNELYHILDWLLKLDVR
jgi:hypothetical protein